MSPSFQSRFLAKMGREQQFRYLFEYVTDVYFFVKDDQSRMVCASRPILDRLGVKTEADVVGTTDYDYFPPHVADAFVEDDRRVMSNGKPL